MTNPTLGIMTVYTPTHPPFPEKNFFKTISQIGQQEGIPVMVFYPNQINFTEKTVKGFALNTAGEWVRTTSPIPQYIYDRCFYTGSTYNRNYKQSVSKLLQDKAIHFLGIGLKGKWQMFETVSKHSDLKTFLPPTEVYSSLDQLKQWLEQYSSIILKPINGSLGIGVLRVTNKANSLYVEGRGTNNGLLKKTFSSPQAFASFLSSYVQRWKYLIQPYLTLRTDEDIPFDIRILVQKDGTGQWSTTGKALRIGSKSGITSNLHGGGNAYSFEKFMSKNYTPSESATIAHQMHTIETTLPEFLDHRLGPLVELGIDIGVDSNQKIWLIEVNSKPGREIFERLNEKEAVFKSQANPLYYAKFLMQSHGRLWQGITRRTQARRRPKTNRR